MLLQEGSFGEDVQILQSILRRLLVYDGPIHHIFDNKVKKAVLKIQKNNELLDDGIVGPNTWETLRKLNPLLFLMFHCSATPEDYAFTHKDILKWHLKPPPVGRGWKNPGYSKVYGLQGEEWILRDYNEDMWVTSNEITNGAIGFNKVTRHYCYIGGMTRDNKKPKNTLTLNQKENIVKDILYYIDKYPHIKILGHNQVSKKACPSFDVPKFLIDIGVSSKHIYKE